MTKLVRFISLSLFLAGSMLFAQSDYRFSDGGKQMSYRLAENEVFTRSARQLRSGITSPENQPWGGGSVLRLESKNPEAKQSSRQLMKAAAAQDRSQLSPVFYDNANLPSAERLAALAPAERERRMASARRVLTPKLHIYMDPGQFSELSATQPLSIEKSLLKGWSLVTYSDAFAALEATDWLTRNSSLEFTPVFSRMMNKRQTLSRPVNDTLYPRQWHLQSTQFNLTMRNAWDFVTGKDINMTIVDDGLEILHEDLSENSYQFGQGLHANFNEGDPGDPSPLSTEDNHGTSCAGLAAAVGFNNIGVIGVAPQVGLMGLRLISGDSADDAGGRALAWQPEGIITHVSSNSWGPPDDGEGEGRISAIQLAGMEKAANENRTKLGTVIVVSAGNGRDKGDDESYDGFSSSRFAIAVAAVERGGKQSSYSESGMAVAISAFGGEDTPPNVMWTTNNMGAASYDKLKEGSPTTLAPINYTDSFNGTSAAAPQVSGAVALMLQRNPRLGYRDVKEILMRTANRTGLEGKDKFETNAGGFQLSHSFGAGLVNVSAALELANRWTNLGPLTSVEAEATGPLPIADNGTIAQVEADFAGIRMRVEHVEITFTLKHANRGDLGIGIVSPSGMVSLAQPRPNDDNADFTDYTMTSVMHWGEAAAGKWTIAFTDTVANQIPGTLTNAKIKLYGSTLP